MSAPVWRNRIISYDTKPASQFSPNPLNWRTHPSVQREALRGLLGDVGWVGAVLENKQTGNLIDGHARIEEALSEDSTQLISYLLVDLTPEEEKLVLASFDPISALATADSKRLEELLKDVSSSSAAVDSMLSELAKEHGVFTADGQKDAEPQIDKAEELNLKWRVVSGDLFIIGDHVLLCGDCAKSEDIEAAMGRARILARPAKADAVVTDPPFFAPATHYQSRKQWQRNYSDMSPLREFWRSCLESISAKVASSAHWFVFSNCDSYPPFYEVMFERFEKIKTLVWDKGHVGLGRIWRNQHELILWARNGDHYVPDDGKLRADVLRYDATQSRSRLHSVEKPSSLLAELIEGSTERGGIILEPFAGSGTTLIACENLSRRCYAIEISPAYVAVCLERMTTAFPHLKIEKVDQARAA